MLVNSQLANFLDKAVLKLCECTQLFYRPELKSTVVLNHDNLFGLKCSCFKLTPNLTAQKCSYFSLKTARLGKILRFEAFLVEW